MKHVVNTTSVFPPDYPANLAIERMARLGYTHIDMAFDYCTYINHPFMSENWREWAYALKALAEKLGVQ